MWNVINLRFNRFNNFEIFYRKISYVVGVERIELSLCSLSENCFTIKLRALGSGNKDKSNYIRFFIPYRFNAVEIRSDKRGLYSIPATLAARGKYEVVEISGGRRPGGELISNTYG